MRQWLIGSFLGALVMMLWGFIFWATPFGMGIMKTGAREDILRPALTAALPEDGVYFLPGMSEPIDEEAWKQAHREGPLVTIFYTRVGCDPMRPSIFFWGFIHMLASSLLLGLLLRMAVPALPRYGSRVAFVVLVALAASVFANLGKPIWFLHPWGYYLYGFVYDLLAWILAGLVLARFIRARA